jgi:uncharacterized protein YndB with AHSA1/START domain
MSTFVDLSPIVRSVQVPLDPEEAFTLFTEALDEWWPKEVHSMGEEKLAELVFETELGGRIFERWHDGSEHDWGRVVEIDRPRSISYDWQPNDLPPRPTFIQVTFTATEDGTEVRLEHSRWEALGDEAEEGRGGYSKGWQFVLGRFVEAAA